MLLEVLNAAVDKPTLDEIYRRAFTRDHRICYTTLYRTVSDLIGVGLITATEGVDGKRHYHHEPVEARCTAGRCCHLKYR